MKPLPRPDPQAHKPFPEGVEAPKIDDTTLAKLAARVKPMVPNREDDGHLWFIKPVDLRGTAFTWDPKPTKRAEGLAVLTTIRTLHTFSYYGFFKPSVAEVLAHLTTFPQEWLDTIVAFHTAGPRNADDLNADMNAIIAGYQVAYTTFYVKTT